MVLRTPYVGWYTIGSKFTIVLDKDFKTIYSDHIV